MKSILPLAIASLTFAGYSAKAGFAIEQNARQHNLTVALSVSYEGEYIQKTNGNGFTESQKLATAKLSNKELLLAWLEEDGDVASAMDYTIKGWSIVMITNDEADIVATWLVKKNMEPIDVTEYFDADSGPAIIGYEGKYEANKDLATGNAQTVALAQLEMNFESFYTELTGVLKVNSAYTEQEEDEYEFVNTADFTDLSGYLYSNQIDTESAKADAEDIGIVTGTVKAGTGKAITVRPI